VLLQQVPLRVRDARFRGNNAERNSVFGFVVSPEVLCKETSCDLSDLVKVYMGKYPINPLWGVSMWLICCVLGRGPSVFIVKTIVAVLVILHVPIGVPVVLSNLFLRWTGPVLEFCWVIDCKGYDRVVTIKVNVKGGAGRNFPDDEEGKKQEKNGNQVTKSNEVLARVCFRTVQVVCFLRP
jgi:hypothetical protein